MKFVIPEGVARGDVKTHGLAVPGDTTIWARIKLRPGDAALRGGVLEWSPKGSPLGSRGWQPTEQAQNNQQP